MRRIYKTTTAIVACLSLIAPQLAVAQDQQGEGGGEQQILPRLKKDAEAAARQGEKPQPKAAEQQERPAEQPQRQQGKAQGQPQPEQAQPEQAQQERPVQDQARETPAQAQPEQPPRRQAAPEPEPEPEPEAQARQQEQAQPELAPAVDAQADDQPGAEPPRPARQQGEAPAPKPEVTQAQEPQAKPPVVQAETPKGKPRDAAEAATRRDRAQEEAQKQPEPKPDTPEAMTRSDPAPERKPQQDDPAAETRQPAAETGESPDADELKKALEARTGGEARPKPGQPEPGQPQPGEERAAAQADSRDQAADPQKPPRRAQGAEGAEGTVPDAEELGRRLQERQQQQQGDQQAQQDQTPPMAPPGQPQPGQPQPGQRNEVQAPEARVKPNEVAKRAAEQQAPADAAALAAQANEAEGQVEEVQITRENARRSDEDFETAIMQGLQQRAQPDRQQEAREDDDDDDLKDIGKLLLAGAAGFAVGKMLSNDRQVALNTGDRVVVTLPDGSQQVIKDDNALLYQPGSNVRTESFEDGSTRTTVLREDGSRVVTIRDANMNILRRTLVRADGTEMRLLDNTEVQPVEIATLPAPPPVVLNRGPLDEAALREALLREAAVDRRFTLGQIRNIPEVRALVAPVNVPEITFDTGSSAITPDQAQQLATLGKVIRDSIDQNPREIYMIEGYTDAVGSDAANLALSDRRAESVALALTEYFDVPPENMVVQGYGEQFLLVPSEGAERANRRVAVRRITDLLEQAQN
ncbi:OmpA family protein [Paracoccus binzhouensis]|uniref:OmpA family protein n=1 Tax=Paracoccus binzhouensis TaxID=2796149 RepID=UPI0018EF03CB|nr:OmpA family protein [Paracoccus binzhouensis]